MTKSDGFIYNGRSTSVEEKYYTKDNSSAEEICAIQDCIYQFEPGIIYWYETPFQTEFSLNLFEQKILEIVNKKEKYALIIDLTRAHMPSAPIRELLKKIFHDILPEHIAVFTEKNKLLNIAAKFVLSSVFGDAKHSIVKQQEDAIANARNALK